MNSYYCTLKKGYCACLEIDKNNPRTPLICTAERCSLHEKVGELWQPQYNKSSTK